MSTQLTFNKFHSKTRNRIKNVNEFRVTNVLLSHFIIIGDSIEKRNCSSMNSHENCNSIDINREHPRAVSAA